MVDDLDQVTQAFNNVSGAGSVIGAIPNGHDGCDIELVIIRPVQNRYVLRHLTMNFTQLGRRREHLSPTIGKSPDWAHTDRELATLAEAVALASAIRSKSLARPVPDIQNWRSLGGPFEDQLKRFPMQIRVPFLPTPPLWQRAGRQMLITAWAVTLLLLGLYFMGDEALQGVESPSLLEVLLVGLAVIALVWAISLLIAAFGAARKLRPGGAKEPASDTGATEGPNLDA